MLWMCIWVHPYNVTLVQVGVDFRKIGVRLSLNDVAVSWLRLETVPDCITHPYHMYLKCFSQYFAVDGHMGPPLHCHTCAGWGDYRKIGVWLSLNDVAVPWLRLETVPDCIPHPYHMYVKCLSTLLYCVWAYVCRR